jgi:maltooligosyltrehalose trehalohydrolase
VSVVDLTLGARVTDGGTRFRVWAPRVRELVVSVGGATHAMQRGEGDIHETFVRGVGHGDDYTYVIDGSRTRPDPASRWQPHGVHGASRVVDPDTYRWSESARDWRGRPLASYVMYELHVGTFTERGTFEAAIERIDHLVELGVTAVEIMPVAEFPGGRNWGYDGVHMFAPSSAYGGPDGLRALVDACHGAGLAVILDVVYNHIGPEGNYLAEYGPFFTDRYRTPWGAAINYDGPDSDGVRRHVITNALYWLSEYRFDALRLDAIHGIYDNSAYHVLAELEDAVRSASATPQLAAGQAFVIAESDLNDSRVIREREHGGHGLDAQWSDDFHHAVRTALTGDRRGYFADFGSTAQIARAVTDSFVYAGSYSPHRRCRHGNSAADLPGERFVVCIQNHDQIANGSQGRRIDRVAGRDGQAVAAAIMFATPNLPMLFMGEELAASAPFVYFVSHGDPALVAAVREGRRRELAGLADAAHPELDDPQDEATFRACKLDWRELAEPEHAAMFALYRDLIALRRRLACLSNGRKDLVRATASDEHGWLVIERGDPSGLDAIIACNLTATSSHVPLRSRHDRLELALATDARRYGGTADPEPVLELSSQAALTLPPRTARIYVGRSSRGGGGGRVHPTRAMAREPLPEIYFGRGGQA